MQYRNERVADLRHLLRMTQGELAASIDINASYISKIEHDTRALTPDLASQLSLRHNIPITFFTAEDPIPNSAAPTFRKKANTSARESRFVHVLQKIGMRLFHRASLESGYVTWQPPVLDGVNDPEVAAKDARSFFGIGPTEPVRNVTRLLERNGAGVIRDLALDMGADDALLLNHHGVTRPDPRDDRPLVALFDSGRGDVNRLTAAHELGHLIFDRSNNSSNSKVREERAFRFGGAFLFPGSVAYDWITPDLPLSGYLAIKTQYGISVSAAIRRGKDLGILTPERYRSLMIQVSTRGWRHNEPGHVEHESPLLLGQAIRQVWQGTPLKSAANSTGVPERLIKHWSGIDDSPEVDASTPMNNIVDLASARLSRRA